MKQKIGALFSGVLLMSSIAVAGAVPAEATPYAMANGGSSCVYDVRANGNTSIAENGSSPCDAVEAGLTYLQSNGTRTNAYGIKTSTISVAYAQTTMVVDRWGDAWLGSGYHRGRP